MAKPLVLEFTFDDKGSPKIDDVTHKLVDMGKAVDSVAPKTTTFERTWGRVTGGLNRVKAALFSLKGAIATAFAAIAVGAGAKLADQFNVLRQRIVTATKATGDFKQVYAGLFGVAQTNGVDFATTVALFQSLARTAPELGATNSQMIQLTNTMQQLGVIGGSSTEEMANGLRQFSQSMAGGIVRAEEWNSVVENMPELANRIASGMGKTVGSFRKMVTDGEVSSKAVFDSLMKQTEAVQAEFDKMPLSLGRVMNTLKNALGKGLSDLDQEFNILGRVNAWIKNAATEFTKFIDDNKEGLRDGLGPAIDFVLTSIEYLGKGAIKAAAWFGKMITTIKGWAGSVAVAWYEIGRDIDTVFGKMFITVMNFTAKVESFFSKMAEGIKHIFENVMAYVGNAAENIGNNISQVLAKNQNRIANTWLGQKLGVSKTAVPGDFDYKAERNKDLEAEEKRHADALIKIKEGLDKSLADNQTMADKAAQSVNAGYDAKIQGIMNKFYGDPNAPLPKLQGMLSKPPAAGSKPPAGGSGDKSADAQRRIAEAVHMNELAIARLDADKSALELQDQINDRLLTGRENYAEQVQAAMTHFRIQEQVLLTENAITGKKLEGLNNERDSLKLEMSTTKEADKKATLQDKINALDSDSVRLIQDQKNIATQLNALGRERGNELTKLEIANKERLLDIDRERFEVQKQMTQETISMFEAYTSSSVTGAFSNNMFSGAKQQIGQGMTGYFQNAARLEELRKENELIKRQMETDFQNKEKLQDQYNQNVLRMDRTTANSRLQIMSSTFGAMGALLDQYAQQSGTRSKALVVLEKTAAIAQAMINAHVAASNVLATESRFGFVSAATMAKIVYSLGLAEAAAIAATPVMHNGGLVKSQRSDEVDTRLQSGEYVVSRRGVALLDAINSGSVPNRKSAPASEPVNVQIIDQRRNGADIEKRESVDNSGKRVLQMIIRDTVSEGLANGDLGRMLESKYGLRQRTVTR